MSNGFVSPVRTEFAFKRGQLIAAGCPVPEARRLAAKHVRDVYGQIGSELPEYKSKRLRAAVNEVLSHA